MGSFVVRIRSSEAAAYSVEADGSASLSYSLAQSLQLSPDHMVKLLDVKGAPQEPPRRRPLCPTSATRPQDGPGDWGLGR